MTHFHVLTLLRHHNAMPMGKLADILDASMSSATGIIDRMEERGLVERVRVPGDRRIVLVRPTQAGLDLVDEVELVKSEVMSVKPPGGSGRNCVFDSMVNGVRVPQPGVVGCWPGAGRQ